MGKLADFKTSVNNKKTKTIRPSLSSVGKTSKTVKAKTKVRSYMIEPEVRTQDISEDLATTEQSNAQLIHLEYEKKIKLLEKKLILAESKNQNLNKNEQKLLNAIRSESILQKNDSPIMTRSYIGQTYGINEKYLGESIKGLLSKGLIERNPAKTSSNQSTFLWKVV